MRKIKGHATLLDVERGLIPAADRLANNMADAAAKKGAKEHPQEADALKRIARTNRLVEQVATYVTRVRMHHIKDPAFATAKPARPRNGRRKGGRRKLGDLVLARSEHDARWHAGRYRCQKCQRSAAKPQALSCQPCLGRAAGGHRLWISGPAVFCARCGADSITRSRGLTRACRGRPSECGWKALHKLRARCHPARSRRRLRAKSGPAAAGIWCRARLQPLGHDTFDHVLGLVVVGGPEA